MDPSKFKLEKLHYLPQRFASLGIVVVAGAFLCAAPLLFLLFTTEPIPQIQARSQQVVQIREVLPISLGLKEALPVFPALDLKAEMTFSFDPPRPLGQGGDERLLVRIKHSGEAKRVVMPCRVDLEFQATKLKLSEKKSKFWVDLTKNEKAQIVGRLHISSEENGDVQVGLFEMFAEESPFRMAGEFPAGSPFRQLAEAKWWGRDLLMPEKGLERLEFGLDQLVELKEGDFLVWREGKWQLGDGPVIDAPIARVVFCGAKSLVLEGWDADGHSRLQLMQAVGPPFKAKIEELFSSVRVRSEKQISCMLEKQCMVLKVGDWVLKSHGKWKVLRKKEERDALIHGKISGELFCFEQIGQKMGQKIVQGRLFNAGRSQFMVIETGAAPKMVKKRDTKE